MQAVANSGTQLKWKQVFQEVVFELDPTRLQPKLEAAQKAIEHRYCEVVSSRNTNPRELMELEDALRTISILGETRTAVLIRRPGATSAPGRAFSAEPDA